MGHAYLSIFRWISITKRAGHHQHQRLVLQVHHIVLVHGCDLKAAQGQRYTEAV